MKISRSVLVALAMGAASMVLVSGCGSSDDADSGSRSTLQYVPTTSYALKAPETTTTTTTLAPGETVVGGTVPTEQSYTIKANDSLSKIAGLFDVEMELICSYNGWSDCLSHLLLPGDTILIPPNAAAPGAAAASTDSTASDSSTADEAATEGGSTEEGIGCSHTIVAGDNPSRVANKYDITVEQLAAANVNNPAYSNFLIGSSLNIPPEGNC